MKEEAIATIFDDKNEAPKNFLNPSLKDARSLRNDADIKLQKEFGVWKSLFQ